MTEKPYLATRPAVGAVDDLQITVSPLGISELYSAASAFRLVDDAPIAGLSDMQHVSIVNTVGAVRRLQRALDAMLAIEADVRAMDEQNRRTIRRLEAANSKRN